MSSSALEGRAVFEGEGQAAIRVGRGIVHQTAPELFAEGGNLAVLLFQNSEEVLHHNIYKILLNFENIFSNMDDLERKQFIELLIDEIQIHPEKQENGQWLKSISFKLPIIDQDFDINGWVNNTHVSTCFVLGKRSTGQRRVRV